MFLTRPPLATQRASSPVLPFDLHVLGLPPAFTLSQDQTLHLNFLPFGKYFFRIESARSELLNSLQSSSFVSDASSVRWTSPPPGVRTNYLRTLSKIFSTASTPYLYVSLNLSAKRADHHSRLILRSQDFSACPLPALLLSLRVTT